MARTATRQKRSSRAFAHHKYVDLFQRGKTAASLESNGISAKEGKFLACIRNSSCCSSDGCSRARATPSNICGYIKEAMQKIFILRCAQKKPRIQKKQHRGSDKSYRNCAEQQLKVLQKRAPKASSRFHTRLLLLRRWVRTSLRPTTFDQNSDFSGA